MIVRRIAWIALVVSILFNCAPESLEILYFVTPNVSDCEFDDDAEPLESGVLDLAMSWEYWIAPMAENHHSVEGCTTGATDVVIDGANVRIWRGDGTGQPFYSFYQPAAAFIPAQDLRSFEFVAIPRLASQALVEFDLGRGIDELTFEEMIPFVDTVTVGIVLVATTMTGGEVETEETFLTVELCFGCLIECPPESIDDDVGDLCTSLVPPDEEPCRIGQDQPYDCRLCLSSFGPDQCRQLCESSP